MADDPTSDPAPSAVSGIIPRPTGVHRRQELLRGGLTRTMLAQRVEAGQLRRLSPHWYVTADAPADLCRALSAGARLTCVSALDHAGLWTPLYNGVYVSTRRGQPLPPRTSLVQHRYLHTWPDQEPFLPLRHALLDAALCLGAEDFAVLAESGLQRSIVDKHLLDEVLADLPPGLRRQIGTLEPTAESGSETRVRRLVASTGLRVRAQVQLAGIGRVDLFVEDRLIIECDSRAHHTAEENYHADRRRDRQAVADGYQVIRLTWEDVWLRWAQTSAFLLRALTDGRHRQRRGRLVLRQAKRVRNTKGR